MQRVWKIELLGTLKGDRGGQVLTRFRTRRVASLLAYLAYFRHQIHSRDEIAAMLWPDADHSVSRRNLRQALSSLRHALEPAPLPTGSVVLSIHDSIQLNSETVSTDVADFESLIEQSRKAESSEQAAVLMTQAVNEYKGELLPGFQEDWIWSERIRLEDLYLSALRKLSEGSDPDAAISYLRSGVIREPFNEDWHNGLMSRYLEVGRPDKALDQYGELERSLQESFGQSPSAQSRRLAGEANKSLGREDWCIPNHSPLLTKVQAVERKLSLPVFANRYFGRTHEIQLICDYLEMPETRLVTILGPAGVGKTRLSVKCAEAIAARNDWNVWFVPLADRFSAGELYEAVLAAMDTRHGASSSEIDRIAELAGGRTTLLVLDNMEQIADDAGAFVARLLEKAPNLICLASSRQPLQIAAELIFSIEPLPLPMDEQIVIAELALIPSIQLFVDRCQSLRPDLQLNERNASAIVALCSRLDGLPLAIEIAAGLSNSFSPSQMMHHLPLRQTSLTSRRRDVPARHKSLRAAIDWSYDSLSAELQLVFKQLCVFRGGFTLAEVTKICFTGDSVLEECLDAMQGLQERSLLSSPPSEDGSQPRFFLLTAFREYAEEQNSDDELFALRERHAEFFVNQSTPRLPFASTEDQTAYHLSIELDYDNFTSAIEYSLSAGKLERCVRILAILSIRWLARGPKSTERRLIKLIAEKEELNQLGAELQVQVLRMLGTTYIRSGEYGAAYDACSRAVKIAVADGDPILLATCYSGLSVCAGYSGKLDECIELCNKVLELAGSENLHLAERSYLGIGSALWNLERKDEASAFFDKARRISEKLRGGEPDALIVINQARAALDLGKTRESLRYAHEAIRISKRLRDDFTLAVALTVVSRYQMLSGNFEAATATNLEALEKCKQGDFLFWIVQCLRNQALLWSKTGKFQEGVTLLAATVESAGTDRKSDARDDQIALDIMRQGLSKTQFESAWAKGLAMDRSEAIRFVSSIAT